MALKKSLAQRLLSMSRVTSPALTNCRISSSPAVNPSPNPQKRSNNLALDPGDDGIFRRYLHRQSVSISPELRYIPTGEKLIEKLRGMDIARDRIQFDGLKPPVAAEDKLTVADVKKIFKFSQLEIVKQRLNQIEKDYISYSDYFQICAKDCSSIDQGLEFAKILDESGTVIVLGQTVLLRPQQELFGDFYWGITDQSCMFGSY